MTDVREKVLAMPEEPSEEAVLDESFMSLTPVLVEKEPEPCLFDIVKHYYSEAFGRDTAGDIAARYLDALRAAYADERGVTSRSSGNRAGCDEAEEAFDSFLTILEEARKGFHDSEQWRDFGPAGDDFGPAGDNETTYQDMLDAAEKRVRASLRPKAKED